VTVAVFAEKPYLNLMLLQTVFIYSHVLVRAVPAAEHAATFGELRR